MVQSDPEYPGMPLSARTHVEVDHLVPLHGTTLDQKDLALLDTPAVPR